MDVPPVHSPAVFPAVLFTPGERLGWSFRDPGVHQRPFPKPEPQVEPVPQRLHTVAEQAWARTRRRLLRISGRAVLVTAAVGLAGAVFHLPMRGPFLALLGFTAGVTGVIVAWGYRRHTAVRRAERRRRRRHARRLAAWRVERAAFDAAERERVAAYPRWGAAAPAPGARRIDVIGGNLWAWEALLAVFGASLLGTRGPVTMVDLTGEDVCRSTRDLAEAHQLSVAVQRLPAELARSDLLGGLRAEQVVDVLVESMHGGEAPADRSARATDDRILSAVCHVLGDNMSIGRVGAALRVLMDEPGATPELTDDERGQVAALFSDEYRRGAFDQIRRMEAHLHPIRDLGSDKRPQPDADLTCLTTVTSGHTARGDLLNDLIVQWLTRRVAEQPDRTRALLITGADHLAHRHIQALTNICDRRHVLLVLLHAHLRDTALQSLGAGPVAFMKLGHHEQATAAADFIGHDHSFVVSGLTHTTSSEHSTSHARSEGGSRERSHSHSDSTSSDHTDPLPFDHTRSRTTSRTWGSGQNWSTTTTTSDGSSWSDATNLQRVHEHTVQPRTLQNLPDYALLLVEPHPDGPTLQAVEFHPVISTLPDVSMDPLPNLSTTRPATESARTHKLSYQDSQLPHPTWPSAAPPPIHDLPENPRRQEGSW
ncbi:hypothetical protein Drose_37115 [Dactylosporangium roseum]|uniref:Uncharacterized protein n=1 Tax=Dactylosporangium roseum TaxID=47989 RepID=A0ABY5Z6C1_9ACTN|nr:hypothetical protein [Dactylosporangium roseum]UWZ36570.1 hypothetical protein Drose_37115 [Dactylosporangium roseum]